MTAADREAVNRLVVDHLVRDEADALTNAEAWREVACAALDLLSEQRVKIERQHRRITSLCEQLRPGRQSRAGTWEAT